MIACPLLDNRISNLSKKRYVPIKDIIKIDMEEDVEYYLFLIIIIDVN
jgi:hypothetical protein